MGGASLPYGFGYKGEPKIDAHESRFKDALPGVIDIRVCSKVKGDLLHHSSRRECDFQGQIFYARSRRNWLILHRMDRDQIKGHSH